ncbi:MAG: MFS transporter [Lentilactobacillus diolivorans]|jgi:MHS family alpha-ketoglutarate permease-like MFS transporter|uniref:Putative proline/betaine transporter n=2 Tax=Lentilactobacillus diolivorans TaxID=179838 RepID=A0A0R1SDS6_9LACO|nr:MFS transporter [Lentilactobacillus diolivorans]RRG01830.1 MAG: MFS transporter [Lactobacillus sp.]KRL64115.1 major facilitator superfamily protein [Lentilactobacillus diolivorans DSM 14421]MCH4164345.1 MFS transporter [Lentilactobacillus diolivorans]MDH5106162.1 MFS transporter [Lentilactobacillus diolivorans]GEP23600.1 MFS transporter [Lentilactobacillus diolivorans]
MQSLSQKRITSNIIKGSLGNMIEWFDWYIYASFAIYFANSFFPDGDQTVELLSTAAVFAVGFLMRPFGSFIMGKYADQHGRRSALTLSVSIMAGGSLLIALIPTYGMVGIFSPILLILIRLVQGLSLGGEYGISATYLSEMATANRRGYYASFQYVTLISGQLLALVVQIVLQLVFTDAQLRAFGWRIPFAIGAVGALIVLYLRLSMDETNQFKSTAKKTSARGTLRELAKYPNQVLTVMGLTFGGTIAFYTYTTYMQKYMINSLGLAPKLVTMINFLALLIFMSVQPLFGHISDKIGRKPLLYWFGIGGTLLTVPIFMGLQFFDSPIAAFLLMLGGLLIVSGYTSINAIVKAELFPTEIRALGVGFPYGLTVAIFGGTVEYVALWLKHIGHEDWFFYYVSAAAFVSFLVYVRMLETSKHSALNDTTTEETKATGETEPEEHVM